MDGHHVDDDSVSESAVFVDGDISDGGDQSLSRMIPMMLHRMTVISMTIAIPPAAAVAVTEESDVAWTCTSRSEMMRAQSHGIAQWFMIHLKYTVNIYVTN